MGALLDPFAFVLLAPLVDIGLTLPLFFERVARSRRYAMASIVFAALVMAWWAATGDARTPLDHPHALMIVAWTVALLACNSWRLVRRPRELWTPPPDPPPPRLGPYR